MNSARSTSRSTGRHPEETPRTGRSDLGQLSSRSNNPAVSTGRQSNPNDTSRTNGGQETFRTSMDTARVHTALAALSAEKQALLAKLNMIDSALEVGEKKRIEKPRLIPTGLRSGKNTHK